MRFISYLRSRPVHERRILAIAAYAAIAAVIIAAWIVSFRNNLARIPEVAAPAPGVPASAPPPPAANSLKTPFQTLSETWRRGIEQFKEVAATFERIGRGEEESRITNQKSRGADTPEAAIAEEGVTVRILAGGDSAPDGSPPDGPPLAKETPAPVRETGGRTAAGQPGPPSVAERLAQIGNSAPPGDERGAGALPGGESPAVERPAFFAAFKGVLSSIVRSFASFVR